MYQDKIIEFENSNFSKYDLLQNLYQSIKNQNKVNLVYYCHKQNDISAYTVFPLLLKEYRNNWYLIIENKYNEPQGMNLNFIFDVVELETKEVPTDIVDFEKYLNYSVGVEIDSDYLEEVEIFYKAAIANEIKINPLHKSQEIIEEHENGDIIAKYKLYITDELVSEILKFGNNAFVSKNELVQQMMFDEMDNNWVEYRRALKHWGASHE